MFFYRVCIKELDFSRYLIPGLFAAASGYGVYFTLLHTSFLGIYIFPNYPSPVPGDFWWALLVGIVAGFVGILCIVHRVFSSLNNRPVVRAVVDCVVIGIAITYEVQKNHIQNTYLLRGSVKYFAT